jgi:hypothetical protein
MRKIYIDIEHTCQHMIKYSSLQKLKISLVLLFVLTQGCRTSEFSRTSEFPESCESTVETFQYAGCSVNYTEIFVKKDCQPCSGVIPCISGFEHNKKMDILDCLCNSKQFEDAKSFLAKYIIGNDTTPKYTLAGRNYSEVTGEHVCKNRPGRIGYE